jgi:hypothetical protein
MTTTARPLDNADRLRRAERRSAIGALAGALLAGVGGALDWLSVPSVLPIQSLSGYQLPFVGLLVALTSIASLIATGLMVAKPRMVAAAWTAGALALIAATLAGIGIMTLRTGQEVTNWLPNQFLPDDWRRYSPKVTAGFGLWLYFVACVLQCAAASRAALGRTRLSTYRRAEAMA